jgi:hypothetical protein
MLVVSPIAGLFDRSSPTSNWISLMRGNDRPAGVKQLNWHGLQKRSQHHRPFYSYVSPPTSMPTN